MSEIEMSKEQIENKVQRRAGKRGRSKSSLDRTIEESEAITKSLGPEPEIAEGRRRTRSSMKGLTMIDKVDSTPSPAKKEKKSTPKSNRGRGRKPLKKEFDDIEEQEVVTNNLSEAVVVNNNENVKESENVSKVDENDVATVSVAEETDEKTNGETSKVSVEENGGDIIEDKKVVDDKPEPLETLDNACEEEVVEKKESSKTIKEPEDKEETKVVVVDKNGSIDAVDAKVDTQEESVPEVADSKIESENTKTD